MIEIPAKRLWKDEELIGMGNTIIMLRKMRDAATMEKSTTLLRVMTRICHKFGSTVSIRSQQEALSDSEKLANAAADFFAAKISKTGKSPVEVQKWLDLLSDAEKTYQLYNTITHSRADLMNVVGDSLIGRLSNLNIDPNYILEWELLKNNNLGAKSIDQILEQNIGVFAPLSGDFLLANTYSSYLRRTRGKSFPVRVVAQDRQLLRTIFPFEEGQLPFMDKNAIAMYIDTTDTGNTSRSLFSVIRKAYPEILVYQPIGEKVKFVQSERFRQYWALQK